MGTLPLSPPGPMLCSLHKEGHLFRFQTALQPSIAPQASKSNSPSATSLSTKVDEYARDEVEAGNLGRVTDSPSIHNSPIDFIPKKNKSGKYRLIVDLSAPKGASVNNGISSVASSFHYITIRETARTILQGAFLAKIDLKAAYRKVPVHPQDHYLLGISWKDQIFCDKVLPFGLRSVPIIFNAVADALAWAMLCVGIPGLVHYLDDFLFWASDYLTCSLTLETVACLSARLGLPVEPSKVEGPPTTLIFLSIEVDTVSREHKLPRLKLARLKDTVEHWATRCSMTKHSSRCS